ncbi:hypothetical protein PIB30_078207 [Stylosanthes scabra]|uniref:RNase H type-1 domain-containing protein n=1 Tax=Stylosanthes scabra TaxID=79078 RepID=A0ABU6ZPM0_9FABA|nr:hypothetical protein [Stylosanthes scabra]
MTSGCRRKLSPLLDLPLMSCLVCFICKGSLTPLPLNCPGSHLPKELPLLILMLVIGHLMVLWDLDVSFVIGNDVGKRAALADTSAAHNGVTDLIRRIHDLMGRDWRVELSLIQRTANSVADALAKYAVEYGIDQLE